MANANNFKKVPKKYQPKGLGIIYEDHDIIVVNKRSGLLTISTDKVRENTAYYILSDYVKRGVQKSSKRVFIVHRLDKETSGVIVFAKHEKAKRYLQDEWQKFSKTYYTVVHGTLGKKEDTITSFLAENSAHKVYSVKNPEEGKIAKTQYKVIKESTEFSLLEVTLLTGRKNQIRVHMAESGHPIAGDRRYGDNDRTVKNLALHAGSLTIIHPHTKKEMTFESQLPVYIKKLLRRPSTQKK